MSSPDRDLLHRIDRYLDAAPRTAARSEPVGPFTLFVNDGPGWRYYARPAPGSGRVTGAHVAAVMARQEELGVPRTFEWVTDLVPTMEGAAREAGLEVARHPLMHLPHRSFDPAGSPQGFAIRLIGPGDDVAAVLAVGGVSFGVPGTDPGPTGSKAVRAAASSVPANLLRFVQDRLRRGVTVTAAAFRDDDPVAAGSHQPVGMVTEIVGVGTVPAFRRRGLGRALTSLLVRDARGRGIETIFLSAGDEEIARVYARLGFVRVGTAGAAEPPPAETPRSSPRRRPRTHAR
jgi:ribosomal protein S18 acetylase RimI-like enzyme